MLLNVEVEQTEDQIRYTSHKLQPLEDALEGKIHEIHIHLSTGHAAPKIKKLMDQSGKGRSKITLFAHLDNDRRAQIDIPGYWSLNAAARNDIRTEKGVIDISEL